MRNLIGALRLLGAILTVLIFGLLIVVAALLPGRRRGISWPLWFLTWAMRVLLACLQVRVRYENPQALRHHSGLLIANHLSYLDIAVLAALSPVRFLAKAEVRALPVIGWAARAIGCVFVERSEHRSRTAARRALAQAEHFPPLVVFPEGACSFEPRLQPFHIGSFAVAAQHAIPLLPCVIRYMPWQVAATIPGEKALQTVWRLVTLEGPLQVVVTPLPVVAPAGDEAPEQLASHMRAAMQQVLDPAATLSAQNGRKLGTSITTNGR